MTFLDGLLLFLAAMGGGTMNAVAGGGSFLTFPTLVFQGVPPIIANATSTVALWPGSIASTAGYRDDLRTLRRWLVPFSVACLVGGYLGAWLLLRTSPDDFRALIPWLILVATLVFAFGDRVVTRLRSRTGDDPRPPSRRGLAAAVLVQLAIAVYGGFFGGGMGIMMLASYTIMGMRDIHAMNGMKSWLAVMINGVAVATFVAAGAVVWPQALVMLGGAVAGGYWGARAAKRLRPLFVRRFVIALGAVLTVYFFLE